MQKIIPNEQIINDTLRERTDLSPLTKTFTQMLHTVTVDKYAQWLTLLDKDDFKEIIDKRGFSIDQYDKHFRLARIKCLNPKYITITKGKPHETGLVFEVVSSLYPIGFSCYPHYKSVITFDECNIIKDASFYSAAYRDWLIQHTIERLSLIKKFVDEPD
jgi:hypothetical protein